MKKILSVIAIIALCCTCSLDYYPETSYNEHNVDVDTESGSQYTTREDIEGLVETLYSTTFKGNIIQEGDVCDWLIYAESRSDNAYCGSPSTASIAALEANTHDAANSNISRDWDYYQDGISAGNQIICNIDTVRALDSTMSDTEYQEWLSQGYMAKAYFAYKAAMLWGDIPLLNTIPAAITAENIEEVYSEYYPPRTSIEEVYTQLIENLTYAAQYGPEPNSSDKFELSKAFAYGMMARIYAEKTIQDWSKVAECCQAIEDMGVYSLVDDYGEMFSYGESDAIRNTSEAIFEVQFSTSSGNWINWMFYRDLLFDPSGSYTWAKWVTPSRNIIAAYEAEGDTERMNANIVQDECTWSIYYPSDAYYFMDKFPTKASGIMIMRLGEIYLLHAEALTMLGDLASAKEYVDVIRDRAGLSALPSSSTSSQETMLQAVLDERRLELAFEGFRFFDLRRHDMIAEVHDAMPLEDSYWQTRDPMTEYTEILPVPETVLDNNPNIEQNPGY